MKVALIVAMAENRAIGIDNRLPWHLPADLRHFKALTMGKPIVMGRKTYESIGRPLPGRENIVVSRNPALAAPGCRLAGSLEQALEMAAATGAEEAMIIGGAAVYREALAQADRVYLTLVHTRVDGDAFFPELAPREWRAVSREPHAADECNGYGYTFLVYERIGGGGVRGVE